VDVAVDVAGLRLEVAERLAEVPLLRLEAVLLVERKMSLDGAGAADVSADIEEHRFLL
jgi:hypothetical protein